MLWKRAEKQIEEMNLCKVLNKIKTQKPAGIRSRLHLGLLEFILNTSSSLHP